MFRFFSLSVTDRIKAVSIENKWFATVVQLMYDKFKIDSRVRFQLKFDEVSAEEYCIQQIINPDHNVAFSEMNLDHFFHLRSDRSGIDDKGINEELFLKELRYFSVRDHNDTITLSSKLLQDEQVLKYYLSFFSNQKIFQNYCTYL